MQLFSHILLLESLPSLPFLAWLSSAQKNSCCDERVFCLSQRRLASSSWCFKTSTHSLGEEKTNKCRSELSNNVFDERERGN